MRDDIDEKGYYKRPPQTRIVVDGESVTEPEYLITNSSRQPRNYKRFVIAVGEDYHGKIKLQPDVVRVELKNYDDGLQVVVWGKPRGGSSFNISPDDRKHELSDYLGEQDGLNLPRPD